MKERRTVIELGRNIRIVFDRPGKVNTKKNQEKLFNMMKNAAK